MKISTQQQPVNSFSIYTGANNIHFPQGIGNLDFYTCLYYLRLIRKLEPGAKVIVWMYTIENGTQIRLDMNL